MLAPCTHAHVKLFNDSSDCHFSYSSFLGGYLFKKVFLKFFTPGYIPTSNVSESLHSANWVPFAAAIIALIGIFLAWVFYARPYANVKKALDETNRKTFYKWIYHKFYFDEIYYAFVRQFIFKGVAATIRFFEDYVVGGAVKRFCIYY